MLNSILDNLESCINVIDIKSMKILYSNMHSKKTLGDIKGKTCYRALNHNQSGPCDFCRINVLYSQSEHDPGFKTEYQFPGIINNNHYRFTYRLISVSKTRKAILQIITEITETESKLSVNKINTKENIGKCNYRKAVSGTDKNLTELKMSEELFRRAFRTNISIMALSTLEDGRYIDVNDSFLDILGFSREEVIGKTASELSIFNETSLRNRYVPQTIREGRARNVEMNINKKNGDTLFGFFSCELLDIQGNQVLLTMFNDLTELKKAENLIKASLEEKEILLKEIHHRVKNNMMMIASLLTLQAGNTKTKEIKDFIQKSQSRILTMTLVHESLYESDNLASIDMEDYIFRLVSGLKAAYSNYTINIRIDYDIDDIRLNSKTLIPLGLVITEIVTNCFKHAFTGKTNGTINISMKKSGILQFSLTISDDGCGLPSEIDFKHSKTLGIKLISGFAEGQLNGKLYISRENGTKILITFSELK